MEEAGPGAVGLESLVGEKGSRPSTPQDKKGNLAPSCPVLDLSQRGLHHLKNIFPSFYLKLHLQRNVLRALPKDFFQLLPALVWLDLRFNQIQALPTGIGAHRHLKALLLEKNPIRKLPMELGNVRTLQSLNMRFCPLEFPSKLIVQKGPAVLLAFLRICATKDSPRSLQHRPQGLNLTVTQRNRLCGLTDPHANPAGDQEQKHPGAAPARSSKKVHFLPPVDRPAGRELQSSAKSPEELPSETEICRFWKARQEIVQLEQEQAGGLENQLLAAKLPPHLQAALRSDEMAQLEHRSLSFTQGTPARSLLDPKRAQSSSIWKASMGPRLQTYMESDCSKRLPVGKGCGYRRGESSRT